jgi:hypothetical protein
MPVNPLYDTYEDTLDQNLIEDLINESVQIHGINFYYITKTLVNFDKIYGEDDQSTYSQAWTIAGQIKDVFGYAGAGNMMSKFGVEMKDQIIVSIPSREFNTQISASSVLIRPQEGDLLYFPLHKKCFQISFVNNLEFFFALGHLTTYEVTCELFNYAGEIFNTGIPDIDILQLKFSENLFNWAIKDENGVPIRDENSDVVMVDGYSPTTIDPLDDTVELTKDLSTILDFSEDDPFADYTHKRI